MRDVENWMWKWMWKWDNSTVCWNEMEYDVHESEGEWID